MMTTSPEVVFNDLPDASQPQMEFRDSTWFKTHGLTRSLPTPDQVRARGADPTHFRPITRFEELDLFVKYGRDITVSEALCLRAVKQLFPNDRVPVPEVYGWIVDGQDVFLYMQLVRGPTLQDRWGSMSYDDKQSVCSHLRLVLQTLRTTKQDPSMKFVGQSVSIPRLSMSLTFRFEGHFSHGPSKDRTLPCLRDPSPGP
jgi:hypothetical protein